MKRTGAHLVDIAGLSPSTSYVLSDVRAEHLLDQPYPRKSDSKETDPSSESIQKSTMSQTLQTLREIAGGESTINSLTESERHQLLSNERRRLAIQVLADRAVPIGLMELSKAVATREADSERPSEEAVDRVSASLHHIHLPKMAEMGIIDYLPETRQIQ